MKLIYTAFVFLLVLVMSAQSEQKIENITIKNSTILLFDASSSMSGDKMNNAKIAVKEFISGLDPVSDEVALIVFYDCGNIKVEQPFTSDQSVILSKIDPIRPSRNTPISGAIDFAKNCISQNANGTKKKIILFTDGEETCPYTATYKGQEDIEISIIGFDIRKGSAQETKLQDVAKKVGGNYLNADDASNPKALANSLQQAYAGAINTRNLDYATVWNNKGVALYFQGKYDEAIKCFDEAIKLNSSEPSYWNNKGYAFNNQGKYDEAIKAYDEAIKLNSSEPSYWNNKGYAFNNQGKYDEAIKAYDEAIKLNSSEPSYWNSKGNAFNNQGKYDEAIKAYDEAIKLNSSEPSYWNSKGAALDNQKKYDEALKSYDEAIRLNPEYASAWNGKGVSLVSQGKYDEAIQACDEAIRLDPINSAVTWYNKGSALGRQGKYDEAIKCFNEAIKLDPKSAFAWNGKGSALDALGKHDEAIKCFDEAIKLDPTKRKI